ncbi:hypothetical protein RhiirA4_458236 [Rhizophagus irregularis]|uniref:Uncharacterized protein n=1 Tax=Rhizophagus irregularis TaxID=588596 RepID=A0A2I1GBR5_9GLOM|nr:hypothetical protein RhiirA4_458236 [Rhizophagus irregularis]
MEYENPKTILDSDKGEYNDTNVEITLCFGMLEYYMSQTEMDNFTDKKQAE